MYKLLIYFMAAFLFISYNNMDAKPAKSFHCQELHFKVYPIDYTFSRVFDFISNKQPMGSVVKSSFHVRTHYDLYSAHGEYEGQGICKILCLGAFYVWGTEINIYDAHGDYYGFIDGQTMTTGPAKFSIYDKHNHRVAIAYLDEDCRGFSVVHPENHTFVLARLNRKFIPNEPDYWNVSLYEPEHLSPKLLKIFAAFACDKQGNFKEDK